jgi:hypothetical protein
VSVVRGYAVFGLYTKIKSYPSPQQLSEELEKRGKTGGSKTVHLTVNITGTVTVLPLLLLLPLLFLLFLLFLLL